MSLRSTTMPKTSAAAHLQGGDLDSLGPQANAAEQERRTRHQDDC